MFSHMGRIAIHDQTKKPVIVVNKDNKNETDSQQIDELADIIYQRAEQKYHE
jgi:hypothetical protein